MAPLTIVCEDDSEPASFATVHANGIFIRDARAGIMGFWTVAGTLRLRTRA